MIISTAKHIVRFCNSGFSLQAQALYWKRQANTSIRYGDEITAKQYYSLALQCAPEQAVEVQRECFDALADICFESDEFTECIEHGDKGYSVKPVKNEVGASSFLLLISFENVMLFTQEHCVCV